MRFDGKKPIEFSDDTVKLEQDNLEETKYVLKGSAPSTDSSFEEPTEEPDLDFGDEGGEDLDLGGEEGGAEKPFDDEPFDAGVEADEDTDPEKYIQQLSGKLGQSLRQHSEDTGEPDFDLEKFAVNSVLSATHTGEMDAEDQKDIIKKVKTSGDDGGDEELEVDVDKDVDVDIEGGDEELDFGEEGVEEHHDMSYTDYGKYDRDEYILKGKDIDEIKKGLGEGNSMWDNDPNFTGDKSRFGKDDQWESYLQESENDMMLSNLKNMKQDADKILSIDKNKLDKKLKGMDWADDHISTSTDDTEEVADFLTTEGNSPCWDGYERVPNTKVGEKGSCRKKTSESDILQESEKKRTFVNRTKVINDLRLMENEEPTIAPKPAVKPSVKPARPLRETDRPFSPKRRTHVQPDPKAETDNGIINDEEGK